MPPVTHSPPLAEVIIISGQTATFHIACTCLHCRQTVHANDGVPFAPLQSKPLKVVVAFNFLSSQTCFLLRYMFSSVIRAALVRYALVSWVSASGCCWIFRYFHRKVLLFIPTVLRVPTCCIFVLSIFDYLENTFVLYTQIQRCSGGEEACVHLLLLWLRVHVCAYRQISVFQKTNEIINSPLSVQVWF